MIGKRLVNFDTNVNYIKPAHYTQHNVPKKYTWDYANMGATNDKFNAVTKYCDANDSLKNENVKQQQQQQLLLLQPPSPQLIIIIIKKK
jgi:hypothetical protein